VRYSLRRLVAMRRYMREVNVTGEADPEIAREVGMEPAELEEMFRQVAIGDYDERYVIPRRHGEVSPVAFAEQGSCGIDFAGRVPSPLDAALHADGGEQSADDFDLRDHLIHWKGNGHAG
jgi:nitrate reductase beta subunit